MRLFCGKAMVPANYAITTTNICQWTLFKRLSSKPTKKCLHAHMSAVSFTNLQQRYSV